MDFLSVYDFKQLEAFFLALQQSRFNLKQTPSIVMVDGVRTPVDKVHCLNLLRSFPDLSAGQFKDDNLLIKYLSQPGNLNRILGRLTKQQQTEITRVLEEKPVAVEMAEEQVAGGEAAAEQPVSAGEPPETMGGVPGLPIGTSPSARRPGRVIYIVPKAPAEEVAKPEITVANKSGYVAEPGNASKLVAAGSSGTIKEAGEPEKLVKTTRTGKIVEAGEPSKLVTADRSDRIVKGAETPTSKIFIANKSSAVVGEHTIAPSQGINRSGFKMPYSYTNVAKNFSSNAQIFAKKNLGRIGQGLGEIARGVGRGLAGPGISGAYNLLGKAANGGLNAFERLSNPGLRGATRSFVSSGSKKLVWGIVLGMLFFVVFTGLIGGLSGTTPSTSAGGVFTPGAVPTPTSTSYDDLHQEILSKFKVEFQNFDPNIHSNYLQWAREKLYHASTTQFLSLARGSADRIIVKRVDGPYSSFGVCSPPTINISGISSATGNPYTEGLYKVVFMHELSHLIHGCSPQSRLNQLQNIINQEGYLTAYSESSSQCPITQTPNLTEDYAEMLAYFLNQEPEIGEATADFGYWQREPKCLKPRTTQNPYKTGKFTLHQKLAAEILGVSGPLTPTPVTELAKFSCPVRGGGPNILPSYQADPKDGHCGTDYNIKLSNPQDRCQGNTRRGKSIDIDTCQIPQSWEKNDYSTCGANGKDVELPTIGGQKVDWKYIGDIPLARKDCFDHEIVDPAGLGGGCGTGYIFKADLGGGKNWVLHLLHMGTTTIQPGEIKPSGTIVGKTEAIHTHISIGQDVPDSDIKDQVKSYWKSVDTEMKLCQ